MHLSLGTSVPCSPSKDVDQSLGELSKTNVLESVDQNKDRGFAFCMIVPGNLLPQMLVRRFM